MISNVYLIICGRGKLSQRITKPTKWLVHFTKVKINLVICEIDQSSRVATQYPFQISPDLFQKFFYDRGNPGLHCTHEEFRNSLPAHPVNCPGLSWSMLSTQVIIELRHEISNNVLCVTSKASDRPVQSDYRFCQSVEYSMSVKLLTRHHF